MLSSLLRSYGASSPRSGPINFVTSISCGIAHIEVRAQRYRVSLLTLPKGYEPGRCAMASPRSRKAYESCSEPPAKDLIMEIMYYQERLAPRQHLHRVIDVRAIFRRFRDCPITTFGRFNRKALLEWLKVRLFSRAFAERRRSARWA